MEHRLARLFKAVLLINEDLDLNAVLQSVVDEARSLSDARCGAMLILDESGIEPDFITSGITTEEVGLDGGRPKVMKLLRYLRDIRNPLRVTNIEATLQCSASPNTIRT